MLHVLLGPGQVATLDGQVTQDLVGGGHLGIDRQGMPELSLDSQPILSPGALACVVAAEK